MIIFLEKKNALEKRRKRRERRGGKKRKTNKKRERKRKTGLFQFSKSNLSKSTCLHIFNISLAEPRHHLHDTKFQIRAVLLIIVQCTHMFWTKCKTSVSLKNRNISHSTVWRTLKLQNFASRSSNYFREG